MKRFLTIFIFLVGCSDGCNKSSDNIFEDHPIPPMPILMDSPIDETPVCEKKSYLCLNEDKICIKLSDYVENCWSDQNQQCIPCNCKQLIEDCKKKNQECCTSGCIPAQSISSKIEKFCMGK
jgi:hypothetical protein